jgi:hypothetical protein
LELIHYDGTWIGIRNPSWFDDFEEEELKEKLSEKKIIRLRSDFSARLLDLS